MTDPSYPATDVKYDAHMDLMAPKLSFKQKTTIRQRWLAWCDMHPWEPECKIYEV